MMGLRFFWLIFLVCLVELGYGQIPQILEKGKLEAFESATNGRLGNDMDGDGNYIVIADVENNKVFVFQLVGQVWIKKQELIPWDENQDIFFGYSVSISGDYIIVGAIMARNRAGAVYIFKKNEEVWIPEKILIPENYSSEFGYDVDIENGFLAVTEGTTASVHIFQLSNESWEEFQTLRPTDSNISQALSISGDKLFVGVPTDDDNGASSGAVYIFSWNGSTWEEQTKIVPSNAEAYDYIGRKGFLDADDNSFVVMSRGITPKAYAFDKIEGNWIETKLPIDNDNYSSSSCAIHNKSILISTRTKTILFEKKDGLWSQSKDVETHNYTMNTTLGEEDSNEIIGNYIFQAGYSGSYSKKYDKIFIYDVTHFSEQELTLQQILSNTGSSLKDYLGRSTTIDNNYLAIGAASYNNTRGAVYTYKRKSDNTWEQLSQITKEDGEQLDQFGRSVSMSGDYLAISSMGYEDGEYAGLVDIYRRNGDNWIHTTIINPLDYGGIDWDYFGFSLAMENDYLVVGAPTPLVHPDHEHDDHHFGDKQGQSSGAAYVFKRNGTAWDFIDKFQEPTGVIGDNFGYSTAISGNKIVIGAPRKNKVAGVAFVYEIEEQEDTTIINYRQSIHAPDSTAGDKFALSVDIEYDHIIVGAPQDENPATTRGKAYIFQVENNNWNYKQTLEPSNGIKNDRFGWSVAIDREVVVIGANLSNLKGSNSGAAYVFQGAGNNWTEKEILKASDGMAEEQFGIDVSIGGDVNKGTDIIIGASHAENTKGAAYAYYLECVCADNGMVDESIPDIKLDPNRYWNPDSNQYVTQLGILSGSTFIITEECFDIKNAFSLSDVIVTDECSYDLTMELKNFEEPDYRSTNFEDYYLDRNASVVWTATDLCGNTLSVEFFIEVQSSRCLKLDCTNFEDYEHLVGETTRECQNASSKIKFKRKKKRLRTETNSMANARNLALNTPICTFEGEIICENNNEILHEVMVQLTTCAEESSAVVTLCETSNQEGNCQEIFVDSGGEIGNYTNDEIANYTFCPDDPTFQTITIVFSNFAIEENPFGSGCYDFLEVFNGEDNTATSLGQFCGSTLSDAPGGGTIKANNDTGCLTFLFDSDGDSEQAGWIATVNCINIETTDNCTADELTISTMTEDTATYHAKQFLYSASIIESNQTINFKAGQSISLNTGFHAKKEANFLATIEACATDFISESHKTNIKKNKATLTAFPNPFMDKTIISYTLSKEMNVSLQLVDLTGRQIALLENKVVKEKGVHTFDFANDQLKTGTYFVVLSGNAHYETIKLLLIR